MMLVDCQTCPVRDVHCADCMVTALSAIPMGPPAGSLTSALAVAGPVRTAPTTAGVTRGDDRAVGLPLDRAERRAVSVLIAAGLVSHETANAARATVEEAEVTALGGHRAAG